VDTDEGGGFLDAEKILALHRLLGHRFPLREKTIV
jgi:hypothetical protein